MEISGSLRKSLRDRSKRSEAGAAGLTSAAHGSTRTFSASQEEERVSELGRGVLEGSPPRLTESRSLEGKGVVRESTWERPWLWHLRKWGRRERTVSRPERQKIQEQRRAAGDLNSGLRTKHFVEIVNYIKALDYLPERSEFLKKSETGLSRSLILHSDGSFDVVLGKKDPKFDPTKAGSEKRLYRIISVSKDGVKQKAELRAYDEVIYLRNRRPTTVLRQLGEEEKRLKTFSSPFIIPPSEEIHVTEGRTGLKAHLVQEMASGDGEDLRTSNASLQVRLTVLRDVAEALRTMHEHESPFIHRDVKPGNILYFKGPDGRLRGKLADFGFAAKRSEVDPRDQWGTMGYRSPEIVFGGREGGHAPSDDMYAFGRTLRNIVDPVLYDPKTSGDQRRLVQSLIYDLGESDLSGTRRPTAAQVVERLEAILALGPGTP